jgi:hypothetical protein
MLKERERTGEKEFRRNRRMCLEERCETTIKTAEIKKGFQPLISFC